MFPECEAKLAGAADWSFLANHTRVLLWIVHDPDARLRDLAASPGITEGSAHAIVTPRRWLEGDASSQPQAPPRTSGHA